MSINLQKYLAEPFEDFSPEYTDVLERSTTEWLVSAHVDEIVRNRPSLSTAYPAPYATGLFYCEPTIVALDEHPWESIRLMTTKERVPLYYKKYTQSLSESSRYEKRVYKPYEDCGAVVLHLRMIDLPDETSGDDTDKSTASVDYGYLHDSPEDCGYSKFLAIDDGAETENGNSQKDTESKGVDMLLPECSVLSKDYNLRLAKILSRKWSCVDIVEAIHDDLTKIKEEMRNGQVSLEKYVITKALTESPEAYPDSKSQPHVQVALRMRKHGYEEGFNAKDTVPYIICYEQGNTGSDSSVGIAERARHPDDLEEDKSRWLVDIDYYLAQQIHPVASHLCAEIEGTSPEKLAECLGLDPSKYGSRPNDPYPPLATTSYEEKDHERKSFTEERVKKINLSDPYTPSDEERYEGCEPLALTCPSCSSAFNCPSVTSSVCALISKNTETEESDSTFWLNLRCPKCVTGRITAAMIANQVKRQLDGFMSKYFKATMMCDDCQRTTRSLSFHLVDGRERGTVCPKYPRCNGTLLRKYTAADLYKQLSYFCHILDTRCSTLEKKKMQMDAGVRIRVDEAMANIKPAVEKAAAIARNIRDRSKYGDA